VSVRFLIGDARAKLKELPDESVHCVVTSPPYFGLRDYGTAQWEGGDPACDHRESSETRTANSAAASTLGGGKGNTHRSHAFGRVCGKCGARCIDSQIGLEATPAAYVAELVAVFREVRRVLRSDGTVWLNMGDSYSAHNGGKAPGLVAGEAAGDGATCQAPRARCRPQAEGPHRHPLAARLCPPGGRVVAAAGHHMVEGQPDAGVGDGPLHQVARVRVPAHEKRELRYDAQAIKEPCVSIQSPECVKHRSERSGNGRVGAWNPEGVSGKRPRRPQQALGLDDRDGALEPRTLRPHAYGARGALCPLWEQ
jgi:hypothetical protein